MITNPVLQDLLNFESEIRPKLQDPASQLWVLQGDWEHQTKYKLQAAVVNLRFNYKPWFIVYCCNTQEVADTYTTAVKNNLPVRIRSSGHDHEAECSGDDTVLIDTSQINHVHMEGGGLARIGPGNNFIKLTTDLAKKDVMVPHGTCGTVCIAGFTMGGGWGPWTRKYGMCCERFNGATVVLGDGTTVDVDVSKDKVPDLLWALRGGGGMSFGLISEMRIQTFPLPKELLKFDITWNPYADQLEKNPDIFPDKPMRDVVPTLNVVRMWERAILSKETSSLIGTNLMVSGCPLESGKCIDYRTVYNNCVMFGYWEGNEPELISFVRNWFGSPDTYILSINPHHGGTRRLPAYGDNLMSSWVRQNTSPMLRAAAVLFGFRLSDEKQALLDQGRPLPPDYDAPAPHKITSRLVEAQGLGDAGYKAYIESLWSPLILPGNRQLGLVQYTTLGAIAGDFYREYGREHASDLNRLSAFPYKDKQYTIQYQTWWNQELYQQLEAQNNPVYDRTNRALDWIEVVRDAHIPNTSGAFISFKDSSVPTRTYFAESYDELVRIKKEKMSDPLNHFRIRKSII